MLINMSILNLNSTFMRKIIFSTILFLINTSLFSQQTNSELPLTQHDYIKKSKNQKKAARMLLGSGASRNGVSNTTRGIGGL